ncbi:MAG: hypothetical protein ISS78_02120 [Phycisphaerae bacterium]|nr:hypothetical protein [Phycisphaerae bacterium]
MGKKMYYDEQEAVEALGISADEFAKYVRDDKVRVFQDGPRKMFRVDEIDALAGKADSAEEEIELAPVEAADGEEIELAPADAEIAFEKTVPLDKPTEDLTLGEAGQEKVEPAAVEQAPEIAFEKTVPLDKAGDELTLAEADVVVGKAKSKEDTVITAEGISIFDEEDLEIEAADPLAKTQIAPSLEDQVSIEGVGSGSGLLDLTRESDDTSLGAEVLDHIDETTEGAAELEPAPVPEIEPYQPEPVAVAAEPAATFVEQVDPGAGMFAGMLIGSAIVALFLGSVPLASARGAVPGYLEWYKENLPALLIGAAVLVGVATLIGLFLGRAIAIKQKAMRDIKL